MKHLIDLSIIIPFLDEVDSLEELYNWNIKTLEGQDLSYEIIFIDDGSRDNSWEVIKKIALKDTNVHGIRFHRNYGKSQALHAGFKRSLGEIVITMDADLQDNPEEIPGLYNKIKYEGFDLVSGWKKKRYDSVLFKNIPSKIFNLAARTIYGIPLHDFNCGLKAYRRNVIKTIEVYGEMHRYIPVLAKQSGYKLIGEKIVKHQARKYGYSKFGPERFIKGFLDLITLWFIHKFGRRPMYFFGLIGTIMLLIGFCFSVYLGIDKLYLDNSGRLITQRPEFYISLTTMIIGTQFFLAGFLGEIILRNRKTKVRYRIDQTI